MADEQLVRIFLPEGAISDVADAITSGIGRGLGAVGGQVAAGLSVAGGFAGQAGGAAQGVASSAIQSRLLNKSAAKGVGQVAGGLAGVAGGAFAGFLYRKAEYFTQAYRVLEFHLFKANCYEAVVGIVDTGGDVGEFIQPLEQVATKQCPLFIHMFWLYEFAVIHF